jgi:hypothetical protein
MTTQTAAKELFTENFDGLIEEVYKLSSRKEQFYLNMLRSQDPEKQINYFHQMTHTHEHDIMAKSKYVFQILDDNFNINVSHYPEETKELILNYLKLLFILACAYQSS